MTQKLLEDPRQKIQATQGLHLQGIQGVEGLHSPGQGTKGLHETQVLQGVGGSGVHWLQVLHETQGLQHH